MLYSTRPPLPAFLVFIIFLHFQPTFSTCANGQQGCQTCANISDCNSCQPGYLITVNSTCEQCHVSNCQDCHSGTYQCDNCLPNYFLRFYSCNICIPDNCLECNVSSSICSSCYSKTGVNPMGTCQNCSDSNCQICSHNFSECITCQSSHGFDSSHLCSSCNVPECISCYSNSTICEVCGSAKGPTDDRLSCQYCNTIDFKCLECQYDVRLCTSCVVGYGVQRNSSYGGVCIACQDSNCRDCNGNYQYCTYCRNRTGAASNGSCMPCGSNCSFCPTNYLLCDLCDPGYGITSVHSCLVCSDSFCIQCYGYYTTCQKCGFDTGLDSGSCSTCAFHCQSCSPYNFTHCTSCSDGLFVNSIYNCQPCSAGCTSCYEQDYNCSSCSTQYYLQPGNTCSRCPISCLTCFYNSNYSSAQCTSCDPNFSLLIDVTPIVCGQYCGDSVTTYYNCDNQIGILYDGCNDFCQIQPLFNCSTDRSICSYNGVLSMNITQFQRNRYQNKFFIKVQIFPPLYVFQVVSQQQLSQIFCFSDPQFIMQSIAYDPVTHELSISADFSAEFLDNELFLNFQPEKGENEMFFAGVNQNVNLRVNDGQSSKVYYYSSFALSTIKIVSYLSYCIIVLGWLTCMVGFLFRKLEGLEAMFVLQFSWLTFVWLGCPLYLQFEHALLLKYCTGYNHPLIEMNTKYSQQAPYLSQFKLSTSLANNFNLSGIIQIIGFIGVIITYIKFKQVLRQLKQAQQTIPQAHKMQQKIENYLQQTKQNLETKQDAVDIEYQRFEKFNGYYQVAQQSLLYATLFNLIYFTQCTVLLFLVGEIFNVFNISFLALYFLLFFIVILRFIINPHPSGYFRYSFNHSKKFALEHYFFFPLILITAVALLSLSSFPYLSGVPLFLFFLYNLLRKPYKKNADNYRSALNLLVMCSFIGLRVFMKFSAGQVHNSVITNVWLLLNIVMLIVITLIGLVMMIWQYYLINYKLPQMLDEQKKSLQYAQQYYRKEILKQLSTTKMNKQVGQSKKSSILKAIVPHTNKLVDFSNKLNNQKKKYQGRRTYQVNKLTGTIYQEQEKEVKNNQLLSYKKLVKEQNKQKQKVLKYESNNYGSNQKLKIEQEVEHKQIQKVQKQDDEQSQIKQIKDRVGMGILKDQNKFVQYKAALEYIAQKTDYIERKVDAANLEIYQRAYEDI